MANNPPSRGALVTSTTPALFPGPDTLTGQHVTLERLSEKHIPALYESIGSDSPLWTYIPDGPFNTTSEFAHHINSLIAKSESFAFYAIVLNSGPSKGKAVGHICLFRADLPNRVIEVGHILFGAPLQRTRAGTEALYLLGCLVFEKLGYRRWEWKCDSLNAPSKRAAERYGFIYEGTFRQHMVVKGRNRDSCWYSILDSEWPTVKKAFEKWLADENFDGKGRQRRKMVEIRDALQARQ